MKLPARFVAGNLVWTREGSVWALFRVDPATYPWLTHDEKLHVHRRSRSALISLPGEAMVLSLCLPLPPEELARRIGRPDPHGHLARSAAVAAALDPVQRLTFLAAELPTGASRWAVPPALAAARSAVAESLGLPPIRVGSAEIDRRSAQAHHLRERLRPFLELQPAGTQEVCWIYAAAVARGSRVLPPPPSGRRAGWADTPQLAALGDAVFTEGGAADDEDRPRHRRYLRVDTEQGAGYQALLALSDMPHHFGFPGGGGEWLIAAEQARFAVDWCLRIRPVDNPVAQASARRHARQLQSQVGEYDGDPAGAPPGLAEAMEALGDLRIQLAANPSDAELRVTTILALGSDRLGDLEEQVTTLRSLYAAGDYQLHRPIGGQLGLFAAMLPGSPSGSPARDYVHHLLGRDLAAGMPFGGVDLGDPRGAPLGYSLDAGTFRPVLFDPAYGPSINRSGSLGVFGALGSGKSYFIKNAIHATLARGGRVTVLDRTISGEYARVAELAPIPPGGAQVVTVGSESGLCLDPLRIFGGRDRLWVALGFLTLATGTAPGEPEAIALAEALEVVARSPEGRLADVVPQLERAATPHAETAWRILRHAARNPLARVAFGAGDPVSLQADYLVFHAPGLSLPDRAVALTEHLARRLLPEQVLSQALLYLVAAVARQVTFSDPGRFAAAVFDEAWCLTSSLQGRALLLDGIRDGRKHNAAVWLLSQHPNDLGDDELAHLLGPRFVFRQSAAAAEAALHFVGVEPTEAAIAFLTSAPEGACLYRDVRGRVGRMQVLPALSRQLHASFDTNPTVVAAAAAQPA